MGKQEDVINLIADILNIDKEFIGLETKIEDVPEWDSLAQLQIIGEFEYTFNITIPMEDIIHIKKVSDLIKYIGGAS
jgi:acyl carrier protein